jgi:hypothetical protein
MKISGQLHAEEISNSHLIGTEWHPEPEMKYLLLPEIKRGTIQSLASHRRVNKIFGTPFQSLV